LGRQGYRLLMQLGFFLLQNPFLNNFFTGRIYQGPLKRICTPGLNCYSCPAAAVSCPMGAMQLFFSGVRYHISLYVTGFLLTVGVVFGRFICGYLCPMGLLQDLLYRIKSPKLIVRLRLLKYVKYGVLLIFVIILPIVVRNALSGLGHPWFCAYICPVGTIFGAVPLLAANDFLRDLIGMQFAIKITIAATIVILSVFIIRIFCRVLCPLGAIYGILNKVSIVHVKHDAHTCTDCGQCATACHIKIEPMAQPNAPECYRCGRCVSACEPKALQINLSPKAR